MPPNKASIGLHGAEGPGALQKDQNFDSRYGLGGLQSLAAAGPDKDPDTGQMLVPPNKASIGLHGAEGPDALQDKINASIVIQL